MLIKFANTTRKTNGWKVKMPSILEKEKHLPTDQFLGSKVVLGGVSIPFEKEESKWESC